MTVCSRFFAMCGLAGLVACLPLVHAALTLPTRVIYEESQGEAVVGVEYPVQGPPVLMQAWLDTGVGDMRPSVQNVPFVLTPAVARIESGQTQTVRILRTRGGLPQDRESLFYLNVLEVPPESADVAQAQGGSVQFAAHTRVKFFYRPRGLTPSAQVAPQLLRFTLENSLDGDGPLRVRVHNPSPYNITLRDVGLHAGEASSRIAAQNTSASPALAERGQSGPAPVVPPMSETVIALALAGTTVRALPATLHVTFSAINDSGGVYFWQKPLEKR